MIFKSMIQKPEVFSGKEFEDVDKFLDKFELVSIVNSWRELEKLTILPLYLKDSAEKLY